MQKTNPRKRAGKKKNKKAPIPGNAGPNPKHPINLGFDAWNLGRGGR